MCSKLSDSIKSIVKRIVYSRPTKISDASDGHKPLIILGNGPSLNQTLKANIHFLKANTLMAVNFAAITPEFQELKPRYYTLADPHFFNFNDEKVAELWEKLNVIDWEMTLFLPLSARKQKIENKLTSVSIEYFNAVGAEGYRWLTDYLYKNKLAMPRPRNVLIPSIMLGIWLGYKEIYIAGADHSWMKTLRVDDENNVVSIQPHFYSDDKKELARVMTTYKNYRLHDIILSFYVAFKAYHELERYARKKGVAIYNATPDSFIDAFQRKELI